jgi:hypothetical protein
MVSRSSTIRISSAVSVTSADPSKCVEVGRFPLVPFKAEVWHHWRAEIRWSLTDGSVKVWHDDTVVKKHAKVQTVSDLALAAEPAR